jgi:hypothetical protein
MKLKFVEVAQEATPAGKRTYRINVYGNVVGYVSGRRFKEFGLRDGWNEREAEAWVAGRENEEWWNDN